MREYREILKKHNVTLLPAPASLDSNAWYVHDLKLLYVKDGLSDADFENVMLHEIKGHIDLEHELHELNDNIVQRRMEREANEIMADKLIDDYIQSCTTRPTYVDVEAFIDQRKLSGDLYTYIDVSFRNILA